MTGIKSRLARIPLRRSFGARSRRASRTVSTLALALALSAFASRAGATPQYPGVIDEALQVSCPDPLARCLICHTTAAGGKTAFQPFALTLQRDAGFYRANDPGGLRNALTLLSFANPDSDGDAVPDLEELAECRNPSGEELESGPEYGCDGAHIAPAASRPGWLAPLAALALGALFARRRRASAA